MSLEAGAEQALFQNQSVIHAQFQTLVDGLFAGTHSNGGVFGNGGSQLQSGGEQLFLSVDLVDQTDALGLVRLNVAAGVDQLLGHAGADQTSQSLGAAEAGGDAETHLGLTEHGIVGADADVAAHGQLVAAAQSEAVNSGDDGDGQSLDLAEDVVALFAEGLALCLGQGAHLTDVGACHKALVAGAGDDQSPDCVQVDGGDRCVQFLQDGAVERIQCLGTVNGEHSDIALDFILNECHVRFLLVAVGWQILNSLLI